MNKNSTRLASILGTWTGQTHLKADIGSYELLAYFSLHIMPDPMRAYSCSMPNCLESQNKACKINGNGDPTCVSLAETILEWSDVSAFLYFGAKVDVGFPFNKHRAEDTGGWVGPFNLIMATNNEGVISTNFNGNITNIDRYVSRYVVTPETEFLRMPKNCTLLHEADFLRIAGAEGVNSTVQGQYDPNRGEDEDPYDKYLQTCDNGDLKPILPLIQFDFTTDHDSGEETIDVKLNFKFLTVPRKRDFMYNMYPIVQKRFNKANLGFHISGPFCYGNDPKRGYTFDMNYDSRDPDSNMLKFEHACIEGLPCTPPAAQLYMESQGSTIDVKPLPNDATTVGIGKLVLFGFTIVLLSIFSIYLCVSNRSLKKELAELRLGETGNNDNGLVDEGGDVAIPYQAMEDQQSPLVDEGIEEELEEINDELQQLLPQENNNEQA